METGSVQGGKFKRVERIKSPAEIKNLFKNGGREGVKGAKLFFAKNDLGFNRIAFPFKETLPSATVAKHTDITKHS